MITEFVDHAQQLIAQRGSLVNVGFFRPYHPCVISLTLNEKADVKQLQNVLSFYWGNAFAKALPFVHLDNTEFSEENALYGILNKSCGEVLSNTKAFTNLLELYFVDIIECDAVENDESFVEHCRLVKGFSVKDHTIHKILVLLQNHNQTAPKSLLKPLDEFKSGNNGQLGYDTIFVMSDALKNGGYENDKMRRLKDFMSVLAFNTDDTINFHNTLSGVVGFRDSILTVSAQSLMKPNREIAMASLYGITKALSGDVGDSMVHVVNEKQLNELFGDEKKNSLRYVDAFFDEVKKSGKFPKADIFNNFPYADSSLNSRHTANEEFLNLAVKANFFECADDWIDENNSRLKKDFLEKLFSVFSFNDLRDSENKKIINRFFDAYVDNSFVNVQNYDSAVAAAKRYFTNSITAYWKNELEQIAPNLKKVQEALQEISLDLMGQLNFYLTDESIIDFYNKKSREFLESNGQKMRNNLIFCSGEGDQLKKNLLNQIQELSDKFFKDDDVFALNYIKELNTRMSSLTATAFDAIDFVSAEIKSGNDTNVYFPPNGMANFTALEEICVLPKDEALARKLRADLPSVSIKQIPSGNECVRVAILKVE